MRFKILSLFAVLALLAACETTPQEQLSGADTGQNVAQPAPVAKAPEPAPQPAVQPAPDPNLPVPGSERDFLANVGDRVFFDLDKSDLTPEAQAALNAQAQWLKLYPSVTVQVEGHCDERGTREYNLALGERRASAVRDYLVSLGINAARVSTISYGKEQPAVVGSNEAAWAQNRRGVTKIVSGAEG